MNKRTAVTAICIIITVIEVLAGNPLFSLIVGILLCILMCWVIIQIRNGVTRLGGYLLIVVICVLATVGPYSLQPTFSAYKYLTPLGIVFAALITILAYKDKKLKGYTTGALLLIVFIASIIWWSGQAMLLNVALDHSEAVVYEGQITTLVISEKLWPTYFVNIDFINQTDQKKFTSGIQVSKKRYNGYKKGDMIKVVVKNGFFGIRYYNIVD